MLSDLPLSVSPTSSTVATGHTAMQLDTTDCNKATDNTLALPQALLNRTNWTTRRTRMLIQALIGTDDNRRCDECRRTFSTMKCLKIHVPQHFTVTFCPCGVHHFYRDAILRHQWTQACYTGHLYEVDADSFTEFRDLILPHVTDVDRRQTLLDRFPATRPTVESDSDAEPQLTETTTAHPDVTTQPFRVVVTRAGRSIIGDTQTPTTTISYVPSGPKRKKKNNSVAIKENANPDRSLLADFRKMQKRMTRLCKEHKKVTTEMSKLRDRLEQRLAARI